MRLPTSTTTSFDFIWNGESSLGEETTLFIEIVVFEQAPDYNNWDSDLDYKGGIYIESYEAFYLGGEYLSSPNQQSSLSFQELEDLLGKKGVLSLEQDILMEYNRKKRLQDIEDSFFEEDY